MKKTTPIYSSMYKNMGFEYCRGIYPALKTILKFYNNHPVLRYDILNKYTLRLQCTTGTKPKFSLFPTPYYLLKNYPKTTNIVTNTLVLTKKESNTFLSVFSLEYSIDKKESKKFGSLVLKELLENPEKFKCYDFRNNNSALLIEHARKFNDVLNELEDEVDLIDD